MAPTRVYLTGFMGSGKSTVGPLIAEALGYAFVDLDERIVEAAGRPIPQVFAEDGEGAFRRMEAEALRDTVRQERVVVALGGGALTFPENLHTAMRNGTIVYLRVPIDELITRLMRGAANRPVLTGGAGAVTEEEIRDRIAELMAQREPFYAQATVIVEAGGQEIAETAQAVLDALPGG